MPRGRPVGSKNKSTLEKIDILQEKKEVEEPVKVVKPTKELKVNSYCDLCNSPIYSSPYKVRLQDLTSKATWHRKTRLDRMSLCEKCAEELNEIVDNFVLKKNPSLSKWGNS